jgi:DNA-binding transcriptional MocR family regulator
MLADRDAVRVVEKAAKTYQTRRTLLAGALIAEGLSPSPGTGINLWLPVPNEQQTMVTLAAHGIGVAPGRPFMVSKTDRDYIRITVASVADGQNELAANIAGAASGRF